MTTTSSSFFKLNFDMCSLGSLEHLGIGGLLRDYFGLMARALFNLQVKD